MQAHTRHEQNVHASVCPSKRKHLAKKSSIMTNRTWPTSCSAVSLRQLSYLYKFIAQSSKYECFPVRLLQFSCTILHTPAPATVCPSGSVVALPLDSRGDVSLSLPTTYLSSEWQCWLIHSMSRVVGDRMHKACQAYIYVLQLVVGC